MQMSEITAHSGTLTIEKWKAEQQLGGREGAHRTVPVNEGSSPMGGGPQSANSQVQTTNLAWIATHLLRTTTVSDERLG